MRRRKLIVYFPFEVNFSKIALISVRAHIPTIDATAAKPLTKPATQSPTLAPIPNMQTSALAPENF